MAWRSITWHCSNGKAEFAPFKTGAASNADCILLHACEYATHMRNRALTCDAENLGKPSLIYIQEPRNICCAHIRNKEFALTWRTRKGSANGNQKSLIRMLITKGWHSTLLISCSCTLLSLLPQDNQQPVIGSWYVSIQTECCVSQIIQHLCVSLCDSPLSLPIRHKFSDLHGHGISLLPYDANSTVSQSRASVFAMHVSRERGGPPYLQAKRNTSNTCEIVCLLAVVLAV